MLVAVVADKESTARLAVATLGMVRAALPLRLNQSPLLGHRFTAVLLVDERDWSTTWMVSEWALDLQRRNSGPTWHLEMIP